MTRRQIRVAFALWFAALFTIFVSAWVFLVVNMPKKSAFIPPEIWREPYYPPPNRQFSI